MRPLVLIIALLFVVVVVRVNSFAPPLSSKRSWLSSALNDGGALEVDATMEVVGGDGRIGSLFLKEEGAIVVPRGIAPGCLTSTGPIIVAIPSRDWRAVYDSTLPHRRSDLVWVGNGLLSDWQQNATCILPHFGVLQVGADPVTSLTSPPTFMYGRYANDMAALLMQRGVQVVTVVDDESWSEMRTLAARKLLWASCLWLLCHDGDQPLTVTQVHELKQDQVDQLVQELLPSLSRLAGSDKSASSSSLEEVLAYIKSYSLSVPKAIPSMHLLMAELHDRNGIWLQPNNTADQPFHLELLERVVGKEAVAEIQSQNDALYQGHPVI